MITKDIDLIYYINLDHRIDRQQNFLQWIDPFLNNDEKHKLIRISGIYDIEKGYIGCMKSHILALQTFLSHPTANNCIIFEDDFFPINKETFCDQLNLIFDEKVDFDLIMLSYNVAEENIFSVPSSPSFIKKCNFSYTTSGYLLTKNFASKLLNCFQECLQLCIQEENYTKRCTESFYLDVYWNTLMQKTEKWYLIYPRLGKQYENFSDVLKKVVDYNC